MRFLGITVYTAAIGFCTLGIVWSDTPGTDWEVLVLGALLGILVALCYQSDGGDFEARTNRRILTAMRRRLQS